MSADMLLRRVCIILPLRVTPVLRTVKVWSLFLQKATAKRGRGLAFPKQRSDRGWPPTSQKEREAAITGHVF